ATRSRAAAPRRSGSAQAARSGGTRPSPRALRLGRRDRADARGLQRRARGLRSGGPVPGDRLLEAHAERRLRLEPEQLTGARRVEAAARLPVRHRGVPADLALEAAQLGDKLGKLAARDLLARAGTDRLGSVLVLRREQEAG